MSVSEHVDCVVLTSLDCFKMLNFKLIFACAILCASVYSSKLPSFITPCTLKEGDDDGISRCVLDEARKVQKQFSKGLPELGIATLDPLQVGDLDLITGVLNLKQHNLMMKGLSKIEIRDIKINTKSGSGSIVVFGNLTVTSDYEINGRLLVIPISGRGRMVIKMENTEISMKYKTKLEKGPDGKLYTKTHDLKSKHKFGNVRTKMDGLFGNDPTLGETVNRIMNENWRDLMKEFGPPSVKAVSEKITGILNDFYAKVPHEDLFIHET